MLSYLQKGPWNIWIFAINLKFISLEELHCWSSSHCWMMKTSLAKWKGLILVSMKIGYQVVWRYKYREKIALRHFVGINMHMFCNNSYDKDYDFSLGRAILFACFRGSTAWSILMLLQLGLSLYIFICMIMVWSTCAPTMMNDGFNEMIDNVIDWLHSPHYPNKTFTSKSIDEMVNIFGKSLRFN